MPFAHDTAWPPIRDCVRRSVGDSAWDLWLDGIEPRALLDGGRRLVLQVPGPARSWVASRFLPALERGARSVLGDKVAIELVGEDWSAPADGDGDGDAAALLRRSSRRPGLNPRHTFEQFVIGDANRLAHGAALAVAEMPGIAYNPLYICGPPGLGKSHLLHAIAQYVELYGDNLRVRYVTAEAFTSEFVEALAQRSISSFKAAYRHTDVLLVDDVQFLEAKARTEEEFFHTIDALHHSGAQLVLTSDRPPRDLAGLQDRLRERFAAGLVCDVAAPELDVRCAILRKRADQDRIELDEDTLNVIATAVTDNVRALEGALIRVVAYASLTGRQLDADLASEVLGHLYGEQARAPRSVAEIQRRICVTLGVELDTLLGTERTPDATWARQVAMFLARELTDDSLPAIGRAFGGRRHTTVLHACRRIEQRVRDDPSVGAEIQRLRNSVRGLVRRG